MLLWIHPLIVLLRLQLVCLRVCLFHSREGRQTRTYNVSEAYTKRTVREERTQDTWNLYQGECWQSLPRKEQKRKHFCHRKPDMLITVVGDLKRRLWIMKYEEWNKALCFLLTQECPCGAETGEPSPTQWRALLLTAVSQINLTAWPPFKNPESSSSFDTNESETKEQGSGPHWDRHCS